MKTHSDGCGMAVLLHPPVDPPLIAGIVGAFKDGHGKGESLAVDVALVAPVFLCGEYQGDKRVARRADAGRGIETSLRGIFGSEAGVYLAEPLLSADAALAPVYGDEAVIEETVGYVRFGWRVESEPFSRMGGRSDEDAEAYADENGGGEQNQ